MNFRKSNYNTCISIIHSLFQPFPPFSLQLSNSDPPPSPPKPNIHSLVRLTDHTLWGLLYRAAHPSYPLLLPFPPQLLKSNPHPTPPHPPQRIVDWQIVTYFKQLQWLLYGTVPPWGVRRIKPLQILRLHMTHVGMATLDQVDSVRVKFVKVVRGVRHLEWLVP